MKGLQTKKIWKPPIFKYHECGGCAQWNFKWGCMMPKRTALSYVVGIPCANHHRQGKCESCKKAFRWPIDFMRLKDAYCPLCGNKLQATTHLLRWPWIFRNPINVSESIKKFKKNT